MEITFILWKNIEAIYLVASLGGTYVRRLNVVFRQAGKQILAVYYKIKICNLNF